MVCLSPSSRRLLHSLSPRKACKIVRTSTHCSLLSPTSSSHHIKFLDKRKERKEKKRTSEGIGQSSYDDYLPFLPPSRTPHNTNTHKSGQQHRVECSLEPLLPQAKKKKKKRINPRTRLDRILEIIN